MKKITQRIAQFLATSVALFPVAVLAQPKVPTSTSTTINLFYTNTLCVVMNWIFGFVMLLAVVAFLYGAVLFFTAGGDESKVSQARKMVTYSLIGVAVAVLSRTLIIVIAGLVGVTNTNIITCT